MGLVLLFFGGFLAWSHLDGLTAEERCVRAKTEALELARATLDYRADSGQWPRDPDGQIDLTLLLPARSRRNPTSLAVTGGGFSDVEALGTSPDTGTTWLREIPLDPWGQSFRVMVESGTIAVISAGPDGTFDTDPARLWNRPAHINPCDGDDVGLVLELDPDGGIR